MFCLPDSHARANSLALSSRSTDFITLAYLMLVSPLSHTIHEGTDFVFHHHYCVSSTVPGIERALNSLAMNDKPCNNRVIYSAFNSQQIPILLFLLDTAQHQQPP